MLPQHTGALPKLDDIYLPGARERCKALASGQGVVMTYLSVRARCSNTCRTRSRPRRPPRKRLLAWAKANKNRMIYARPANSGPGRTFLMGLPYILGDSNPKDPVNGWAKTWAYLKELGENIEYYPAGTGAVFKELGEGSRDSHRHDHRLGHQSARARRRAEGSQGAQSLQGFHWVTHAHYMGAGRRAWPPEKMAVLLDMMKFLLTPEQQAFTYDEGYFYPGPAVKGVTLDMAPAESQKAIGRVRPSGIREADRRGARSRPRSSPTPWSSPSACGTNRSAAPSAVDGTAQSAIGLRRA